jgi:hypothetical protein
MGVLKKKSWDFSLLMSIPEAAKSLKDTEDLKGFTDSRGAQH